MKEEPKKCLRCGDTKQRSEFHKKSASKDGLTSWCADCRNRAIHEQRHGPDVPYVASRKPLPKKRKRGQPKRYLVPHGHRDDKRKLTAKKLGLPLDTYIELLGKPCQLCGAEPQDSTPSMVYANRVSGKATGVVCKKCATALGFFKHDPEVIERALALIRDPGHILT